MKDARTYKIMLTQMGKDPPDAGDIFPLLKDLSVKEELEENDELKFQAVLASLSVG